MDNTIRSSGIILDPGNRQPHSALQRFLFALCLTRLLLLIQPWQCRRLKSCEILQHHTFIYFIFIFIFIFCLFFIFVNLIFYFFRTKSTFVWIINDLLSVNKLARAASHRSIVGDTRVHYRSRSDAWTSGSLPSTEVEKEIGKADGRASHKKKFPSRSMNFHAFFDRAGHPSCNISWARNSFLLLLLTRHDYTVVSLSLIFYFSLSLGILGSHSFGTDFFYLFIGC